MLLKQLKYFISIVEKENFTEAPIEAILKVDLYGTAVLLEEVGKVIKKGGDGGATVSYYYGKIC